MFPLVGNIVVPEKVATPVGPRVGASEVGSKEGAVVATVMVGSEVAGLDEGVLSSTPQQQSL